MKDKLSFVTIFLVTFFIFIVMTVSISHSTPYTITQLTNNSYHDYHPDMNNNRDVAWQGFDGSDFEVFLYNGLTRTLITNNSYDNVIKLRLKSHLVQSYAFC